MSVDEGLIVSFEEQNFFLLERGYHGSDIDRQFAKAMGVPGEVALQCKTNVSEDRVPSPHL